MKYSYLLIFLACLFSSCLLFQSSRVEDFYYTESDEREIKGCNIELQKLTVQKDLDREIVEENSRYILDLLSAKYREDLLPGAATLIAEVMIKEASFMKGYETLNTVTLEINLKEEQDKKPVFIYLLSDETQNSISSYKYLYEILERSFKRIYK